MMKQEFHIQAIELVMQTAMLDRRQFFAAEMGAHLSRLILPIIER
jgi:desulfoferrodoxin (superoxide reductase-like protein)